MCGWRRVSIFKSMTFYCAEISSSRSITLFDQRKKKNLNINFNIINLITENQSGLQGETDKKTDGHPETWGNE